MKISSVIEDIIWRNQRKFCKVLLFHAWMVRTVISKTLFGPITYVADVPSRRGLCSSCSDCLAQPPVHRSNVGSRAFLVADPQVWNCLPPEVTSAPSLATFRTWLKTFLFTKSYPDIRLIWHSVSTHSHSGPSSVLNTYAALKVRDWLNF